MAGVRVVSWRLAERKEHPLTKGECVLRLLHPQRCTAARLFPPASQSHILPSTGDAIGRNSGCWKQPPKALVSMLI